MADRVQAVRELASAAGERCLILGWVDMPFAEACSLVGVSAFMLMLIERPDLAHRLLDFLTRIVIDFAIAQAEAGCPMLGAGDAAASLISARMYREFALPYEQRVIQAVHKAGGMVKLHICGNTTHLLKDMPESGADLFNVDHLVKLEDARQAYGAAGKCFKGNLDPVAGLLQATPEQCQAQARECIRKANGSRYMLSAGCEIPAAVSDDVFRAFCEAVLA
jgi:MtaA/CmuA family methyltransferase